MWHVLYLICKYFDCLFQFFLYIFCLIYVTQILTCSIAYGLWPHVAGLNEKKINKYIKPTAEISTYFQKESIISRKYLIRYCKLLFNCDCHTDSDIISQVHKLCQLYKQCHTVTSMSTVTAILTALYSHQYINKECHTRSVILSKGCKPWLSHQNC